MTPVRFHREADQELLDAQEWYYKRSEVAYARADHVFIVAIAHQSRRPGYWRHRK